MYTHWLRTMDEGFEISLLFLLPTFVIAAFWLGSQALINALAHQRYGLPLYAYGEGLMPLIACAVEGIPIALALWGMRRLSRLSQPCPIVRTTRETVPPNP